MDHRDFQNEIGGNRAPVVVVETPEGDVECALPTKYEVCGTCEGRGSHVNPSIDSHGIGPEEFEEDPGFAEDYFGGLYDVQCSECHGLRVVLVPDEERCEPALLARWRELEEDRHAFARECAAERRMGA